jgi:hypothetical protein
MKRLDVYLVKLGSGYTYINNVPLSKFSLEWILTEFWRDALLSNANAKAQIVSILIKFMDG